MDIQALLILLPLSSVVLALPFVLMRCLFRRRSHLRKA
jgi:hypothetical protein